MPSPFAHHERGCSHSISNYEPIRGQCGNTLVAKGKYNEFCVVQDKLITLLFSLKSCPYESMVLFNNNASLLCGVPQGSVLGPMKLCLYLLPLGATLRHHNIGTFTRMTPNSTFHLRVRMLWNH